ncbi:glycine zipper domain-containing protein [Polymorphum gilvum]|uniref:Glycine zipper domain-containing protein n=1 Tax=Polymorphum gilvum (strain LMG 25793 / CGMCC 1.9160 / SL003B-26A1) TaxID=991905 RepID=F2J356_POLGS|nr:glycine zipper domain-containing protein [Polymorphum gilvum]ADZ69863.1 hypothetical protein SL003B_1435 [Polymorphum gilvum SL003B-26A1]
MKRIVGVAIAALVLAGCSSDSQRDRTLVGGGLGAATGAAIGAAAGSSAGAALAGAALGAVGGGLIGAMTAPKNCIARDPKGNPYRVACP